MSSKTPLISIGITTFNRKDLLNTKKSNAPDLSPIYKASSKPIAITSFAISSFTAKYIKLAESNAQQVTKIRQVLEGLSLEVASPAKARDLLSLKGGDQVGF